MWLYNTLNVNPSVTSSLIEHEIWTCVSVSDSFIKHVIYSKTIVQDKDEQNLHVDSIATVTATNHSHYKYMYLMHIYGTFAKHFYTIAESRRLDSP